MLKKLYDENVIPGSFLAEAKSKEAITRMDVGK